jgi:hypothetical protein
MPAATPGIYQALGMHLETTLLLPDLIQVAPSVEREPLVQVVEADHREWPTLLASPHSTPTLHANTGVSTSRLASLCEAV